MPQVKARNRNQAGGAQAEPVTLAEVKDHLRVDHTNDDDYINSLIIVATDYTENITGRSLIEKTYDYYADCFPPIYSIAIELDAPPLISVTSIKYYDEADVEQTWSAAEYVVDTDQLSKGKVYPGRDYLWPATRLFPKSVHIEFIAGYESTSSPQDLPENIPVELKQAMLLLIGHLYENRESTAAGIKIEQVPDSYDALIANYKVMAF